MIRLSFVSLTLIITSIGITHAADWPGFRGPNSTGYVDGSWKFTPNADLDQLLIWKVKLKGSGWSAPVVIGDRIVITEAISDKPTPQKVPIETIFDPSSFGMNKNKAPQETIDWRVLCLDRKTGKEQWSKSIAKAKPKYAIHPSNTYATESIAANTNRLHAWFGMAGILVTYNFEGKELWRKQLGQYQMANGFGTGSSPILHDELLFLQILNEEKSFVVAYDSTSGEERWRIDWKEQQNGTSWSTPIIWSNQLRQELIIAGAGRVASYDPKTGQEFWHFDRSGLMFASSPTADGDTLYFGVNGPGSPAPLFAVKAGAKGDISLKKNEKKNDYLLWYQNGAGPGIASPVAKDGLIYVFEGDKLTCTSLTGERKYRERIPKVRGSDASPIMVGEQILLPTEEGKIFIVKSGPNFQLRGSFDLKDKVVASPSVAGDQLFIRGIENLYCIK